MSNEGEMVERNREVGRKCRERKGDGGYRGERETRRRRKGLHTIMMKMPLCVLNIYENAIMFKIS